jgi:hypothetical protein
LGVGLPASTAKDVGTVASVFTQTDCPVEELDGSRYDSSVDAYETVSSLGSAEDPKEIDVPASEVMKVMRPRKHRHQPTKASVSKQNARGSVAKAVPPDGELSVQKVASPVNHHKHADYCNALVHGSASNIGLTPVHPQRQPRTDHNSKQDVNLFGTGSGTGMKAIPPR